jgi:UDP-N-acetyl-D-glucosamine dehydrogenase
MKLCVFGLGYVGLPLACLAAEKGYEVSGVDTDLEKVKMISWGKSPIDDEVLKKKIANLEGKIFTTTSAEEGMLDADIITVCVPTPIDENYQPDLRFVESAAGSISENLKKGQLVILESTVAPMTTETIVRPILEKSGLKEGRGFFLAFCPERIDPGNRRFTLKDIPRVVGGMDEESTRRAVDFYKSILSAEVLAVKSPKEAEAVKIMENTFRDVNIAFVNEMAKSFDKMGIDIIEVIKGASTKPFAFMAHYPGCGVGGHCIAVDPYYLIDQAGKKGFEHRFLKLAREINNSMPQYTVERCEEALKEAKINIKGAKVNVFGLAYKGGVDDTRESPSFEIIRLLKEKGAEVKSYDPHVKSSELKELKDALDCDCVVIATAHPEFKDLDFGGKVKAVVDGRNILVKGGLFKKSIVYRGVGQ